MIRPARSFLVRAPLFVFPLLFLPVRADRAQAIGLGGWIELSAHTPAPSVAQWEPVVWNENTQRILYPEGSTLWSLVPHTDQAWESVHINGTPPNLHEGDRMVFDPVGNRILRFGGLDALYVPGNDVWELSLGGAAPAWKKLFPTGTPPPGRYMASMVIDVPGRRAIVFGGAADIYWTTLYNDAWQLSLTTTNGAWTRLTADGAAGSPSRRHRHTAIFDLVRNRMVVFGGRDAGAPLNDVWALTLGPTPAWQPIATTGPPAPLFDHAAIYDADNDRMIIHGGSSAPYSGVAALPFTGPADWTALPSGPSGRGHTAVYDPAGRRMLVSFGASTNALDLGPAPQWSLVEQHVPPSTQMDAVLVGDTRTMIVLGGQQDTWTLDVTNPLASWKPLDLPVGPFWTPTMGAVWDPGRSTLFAYGPNSSSPYGDLWALTLGPPPAWSLVATSGLGRPSSSAGWRSVYDPSGDRLVFLALQQDPNYSGWWINHNWIQELPLSGPNAFQWAVHDVFPPEFRRRKGASFNYDAARDVAWIFGGADSTDVALNDTWRVDLAGAPTVAPVAVDGDVPIPRADHGAIFDDARDRLVVLGGRSGNLLRNMFAYELDPGNGVWTVMTARGATPANRAWPACVYDAAADRLVMFGGTGPNGSVLNDTWALSMGFETLPVDDRPAPAALALAPVGSNPMRADIAMTVTLPAAGRGSLGLLDVTGRRVRSVSLDGMPAGSRTIALARRGEIPAGLYFAVLHHASGERHARVIVLP